MSLRRWARSVGAWSLDAFRLRGCARNRRRIKGQHWEAPFFWDVGDWKSVRSGRSGRRSWARRSSGAAIHLTSTSTPAASARTGRRRSAPTCAILATGRASSCGCAFRRRPARRARRRVAVRPRAPGRDGAPRPGRRDELGLGAPRAARLLPRGATGTRDWLWTTACGSASTS